MSDPLATNWSIDTILGELPEVRRVDDGSDLLAFVAAGTHPSRTAYVYLYSDGLNTIAFDLEDERVETGEWDHAVKRGKTESLDELRSEIIAWLFEEIGERSDAPESASRGVSKMEDQPRGPDDR